jgi:hypothetical protein
MSENGVKSKRKPWGYQLRQWWAHLRRSPVPVISKFDKFARHVQDEKDDVRERAAAELSRPPMGPDSESQSTAPAEDSK